jgi:predicted ester cyclase
VSEARENSTIEPGAMSAAERVVRSYLQAFAGADADVIAGHVADGFINEHTAGLGTGCVGKAAYRDRLPGFLADMVGLQYEVEDLLIDGERAAAFYTMTASWQGDVPISIRGVQRFVVRNDLIRHRTDYWDSAVFLAQADPAARTALATYGIR